MISMKQKLLLRLTEHLEGVNPDWTDLPGDMAGETCPFDLRGAVFRGRLIFGDDDNPPFIALLEASRQIDPNSVGQSKLTQDESWTLLIQGFAADDPKHPTDPAYLLLAWVQMRLARITTDKANGGRGGQYPNEWRLGGLTANIGYQIPIVRPGKDDVSDTAYFYLPISVGVVTDLTQPFVQED